MVKRLYYYISLLVAMLLTACANDDTNDTEQPLPEGMGRISITICAPETVETSTRAVYEEDANNPVHAFPWEAPDHEWEKLKTFRVYICNESKEVVQVISGDESQMSQASADMTEHTYRTATISSEALEEGYYYIFATANFNSGENTDDAYDDGFAVGETIDENAVMKFANSSNFYIVGDDSQYSGMKNIPMTGKLTDEYGLKRLEVTKGNTTNAGTLMLWRVMAKMQFEFTNESDRDVEILGIEVDPINKVSTDNTVNPGIYLFSKDDLTSTANLAPGATPPTGKEGLTLPNGVRGDMGPVVFTPAEISGDAQPLTLAAKNDGNTDQGKLYFYVNESDSTFTTTNNQYSLRFKVRRKKNETEWYEQEIRYGVTTNYDLSSYDPLPDGSNYSYNSGFNVIRRNDWIHIPIILTDWQLRIEPIAFVPIAGYPAKTVGSDGLTTTFSTGGMIALQPFVKKYSDNTWRDFTDPEVSNISVTWKNRDGVDVVDDGTGSPEIVKTAFAYDSNSKCIIGELNNVAGLFGHNYMTTFTVNVTLGPTTDPTQQYGYSFTFNVILR